jgi:hypothetical protein
MSILSTMKQLKHTTTPNLSQKSSGTRRRPIELQTENGFCIVRRCDIDQNSSTGGTEHCFVVRDPYGYELDITVDFSAAPIAEVSTRSAGRITNESSFWINCAERHLADYLWEADDYPPDGRITVEYLTPVDVDSAQRWGMEVPPAAASALSRSKATLIFGNGDGTAGLSKTEPIKLVTENNFTIVRDCDSDDSINDTSERCHFRVTKPDGAERQVIVLFDKRVIQRVQAQRRRSQLGLMSKYWPVIAEKHLADYLWRRNDCPPNCELRIEELSGDDLLLGAHWQEQA